jgi:hypothetical protein
MTRRIAFLLAMAVILAGGLWLRFHDVREQVLGGDEVHAIQAARDHTVGELFTYYPPSENSIVWSMYTRTLLDMGRLSEFSYRFPAMVSGVLVMLLPLLFRRRIGSSAALLAMAFLATSPCAIYYSFVGRPYGPATVMLVVTLFAWRSWYSQPSPMRQGLFVVIAALTVFMHVLNLFPVGLLVCLSWWGAYRGGGPARRNVIWMTSLLLLAGLALFGPGLPGFIENRVLDSHRPGPVYLALGWLGYLRIAGEHVGTALSLLLLAAAGSWKFYKQEGAFGLAVAAIFPVVLLGMYITQIFPSIPAWTRYLHLGWPTFLMMVSFGVIALLTAVAKRISGHPAAAAACLVFGGAAIAVRADGVLGRETAAQMCLPWIPGFLLGVAGASELLGLLFRRKQADETTEVRQPGLCGVALALLVAAGTVAWTPVPILQSDVDSLRTRRGSIMISSDARLGDWEYKVDPFYYELANDPDAGEIVLVWPYRENSSSWHDFVKQQLVHGKRVVAVQDRMRSKYHGGGFAFANVTDVRQAPSFAWHGARYIVLHRTYLHGDQTVSNPVDPRFFEILRPSIEQSLGPLVHRDDVSVVFDLWNSWPQDLLDRLIGSWEIKEKQFGVDDKVTSHATRESVISKDERAVAFEELVDGTTLSRFAYLPKSKSKNKKWRLTSEMADGHTRVWMGRFRREGGFFRGGGLVDDELGPILSKVVVDRIEAHSFRRSVYVSEDDGETYRLTEVRHYTRR